MCPHQPGMVGSECPGRGWVKRASPLRLVLPCLAERALPRLRLRCLTYKMGEMTRGLRAIKMNERGSTLFMVIGGSFSLGSTPQSGTAQSHAGDCLHGEAVTPVFPLRAQPFGTRMLNTRMPVPEESQGSIVGDGRRKASPRGRGHVERPHHSLAHLPCQGHGLPLWEADRIGFRNIFWKASHNGLGRRIKKGLHCGGGWGGAGGRVLQRSPCPNALFTGETRRTHGGSPSW